MQVNEELNSQREVRNKATASELLQRVVVVGLLLNTFTNTSSALRPFEFHARTSNAYR